VIIDGKKLTFKLVTRALMWRIGNVFFKKLFSLWQSLGFHIIRNHYYQPIPDTRTLRPELWERDSDLVGIDVNEEKQLELLSDFAGQYKTEYDSLALSKEQTTRPYEFYIDNRAFRAVDAEILYCMIRKYRPQKIFEAGSGYSTYLLAKAVLQNKKINNVECELVVFDPYPNDVIKAGFPGLSKTISARIQDVPLSKFSELKENDILFIDSSHVLTIGSDVQYLYLDAIPRLNKGVVVHIHDILLPMEYPKGWVLKEHYFWNEQYVLQAFLSFNSAFEVIWAGRFMHLKHPDKLVDAFASCERVGSQPGSFWIRRVV